jgi:hypothetical protein
VLLDYGHIRPDWLTISPDVTYPFYNFTHCYVRIFDKIFYYNKISGRPQDYGQMATANKSSKNTLTLPTTRPSSPLSISVNPSFSTQSSQSFSSSVSTLTLTTKPASTAVAEASASTAKPKLSAGTIAGITMAVFGKHNFLYLS